MMVKENTNTQEETDNQETTSQKNNNNKKEFFSLLEEKFFSLGKKFLKEGVTNIAMAQIHNTEEKIKSELEHKYKQYQNKALQGVFLLLGSVFLTYGLVSLLFAYLDISQWTHIIFGIIFLLAYVVIKNKK